MWHPGDTVYSIVAVDRMSMHHDMEMSDESDENVMTSGPTPGSGHQVRYCWSVLNTLLI